MGEKLLSVIIPMYQSERYIKKCLNSLILPPDWMRRLEVLVIDDGSTDRGAEVVREYVRIWPESIRLIRKKNGGHGSAVNEGVRQCSGKYFKVLDADDWVYPEGLGKAMEVLEQINVQAAVCGYDRCEVKTGTLVHIPAVRQETGSKKEYVCLDMRQLLDRWEKYRQLCCLHGLIYQTKFYQDLSCMLPEKVFYDDAYFYTVPCSYADCFCVIHTMVGVYRVGEQGQSISRVSRVKRIRQHRKVLLEIMKTGGENSCKTVYGEEYWYRKLVSTAADYFVTAFLRHPDHKTGRRIAKEFLCVVRISNPKLYRRVKGRYCILYLMNRIHGTEQGFERLLKLMQRGRGNV